METRKEKKWYQRWWIWVLGVIFIVIAWNKTTAWIEDATTKEIPNVMGLNHADAVIVLEKDGFEVTEIETNAESILKDSYSNRSVKKGEVFKINNETSANFYSTTQDKEITIYYAENDYTYVAPIEEPQEAEQEKEVEAKPEKEENSASENAEWKEFLKEYEAWADEYIKFMEKYMKDPTDVSLLSDYSKLAQQTIEWADKADATEAELADDPEALKEYTETIARIAGKIASAAYN